MADVVDDDTLQAVRAKWQTDQETLPALFAEPPKAGRLQSPQATPYAQLACELASRELSGTEGAWYDHRTVTVTLRGTKADVVAGLAAVRDVFNLRTELTYPSGARFLRWWPDRGETLAQEETTKDATDVWAGTVKADVWSVRLT